jgi:lambda family phage minor tail protein L
MSKSESNVNKQLLSLQPDTLVELFEIDFSNMQENFEQLKDMYGINVGADTVYRFCSGINFKNPIVWRGESYQPMPIKSEGFESMNDGKLPRPKLILSNVDGVFSRIIYNNEDFVGCRVTRKRTYVRFLDDENFRNKNLNEQGINPFGGSDKDSFLPDDVYYINRKLSEDLNVIVFELSSPLELKRSAIPARQINPNLCSWHYRCEIGCGYKGLAIDTIEGQDLTRNFAFNLSESSVGYVDSYRYPNGIDSIEEWNKNKTYRLSDLVKFVARSSDNPYIRAPQVFVCIQGHADAVDHHPLFDREYWLKDDCNKTLNACKKRFDPKARSTEEISLRIYNQASKDAILNFGGFPGVEGYGFA